MKDKRCFLHPTENIKSRKRDPPLSLRFQYQVQKETQVSKKQKVNRVDNDDLVLKNYPKNKQPIFQQPKLNHQTEVPANEIIG